MDQIFSMGKSLFGGGDGDSSNPLAMFFQLDRDGDGKISEDGKLICNIL